MILLVLLVAILLVPLVVILMAPNLLVRLVLLPQASVPSIPVCTPEKVGGEMGKLMCDFFFIWPPSTPPT